MYRVESSGTLVKAHRALTRGRVGPRVSSTVVLLGVCSLLTDVSSEMVSAVLPLWLITVVHLQPIQYGIVDGLYQGAAAFVRLAGTNVEEGRKIIDNSGLTVISAETLADAAKQAVEAAKKA